MVTIGLKNCINLHACTWTRDGSLNSEILEALQSPQGLRELEINGRNESHYDPQLLLRFTALRKISLIMPSSSVVSLMRPWLQITGNSLRSLTIICKVILLTLSLHKLDRLSTDVSINHRLKTRITSSSSDTARAFPPHRMSKSDTRRYTLDFVCQ